MRNKAGNTDQAGRKILPVLRGNLGAGCKILQQLWQRSYGGKKGNGGAVHSNVSAADYVKSGFDKVAGTLNEKSVKADR